MAVTSLPLVYHPSYSFTFPENHRFPMCKFRRLAQHLRDLGILHTHNTFRPGRCRDSWLHQTHSPDYLDRFIHNGLSSRELRRMNLPWSEDLVKRTLIAPSGTVLTAQLALHYGLACHLAGGTHHAHYDYASGFCILNDLAIAANVLVRQPEISKVLIFDCDVHQGDGTAALLANEPRAFTCSIHCGSNFPFSKQVSDLDVAVEDNLGDDDYLNIVEHTLSDVLERVQPDIVLYDAGVDVFAGDPLGRLQVTEAGIRARDRLVIGELLKRKIPVATVIGGGYDDDRQALAQRHAFVIEEAAKLWVESSGY